MCLRANKTWKIISIYSGLLVIGSPFQPKICVKPLRAFGFTDLLSAHLFLFCFADPGCCSPEAMLFCENIPCAI